MSAGCRLTRLTGTQAGWRHASGMALALLLSGPFLTGCSTASRPSEPTAETGSVTQSSFVGPPLSLTAAAAGLADTVLARAGRRPPGMAAITGPVPITIDAFVDVTTGTETLATRALMAQVGQRVRASHPDFELRSFTPATLADRPLVLLGSTASITGAASRPPAYRVRVVLADLRTGRIIEQAETQVRAEDIDTALAPFFRDSPGWLPDPAVASYIRTVEAGPGQPIDPVYQQGATVQVLVADGMLAYEAGRYREALALYSQAQSLPAGDQMRVYNGVYLANWELGRQDEAEAAFARIIDFGLRRGRLAVKFSFLPGSAAFWPDPAISAPYGMWIRQIAQQADERAACLELTGHSSPTGAASSNDRLALRRAERLEARLIAQRASLRGRLRVESAGAREPIVGTGADDASDTLDRRVEIEPLACQTLAAANATGSGG